MDYAQIKRIVLELINQYSIGGSQISPAYNNQSDYIHRIPNLINQAFSDIHRVVPRRMEFRISPRSGEPLDPGSHWGLWTMPSDCRTMVSGGVTMLDGDGTPVPFPLFRMLNGGRSIAMPVLRAEYDKCSFLVEYEAEPEQLPVDPGNAAVPADTYELTEDTDTIQTACVYAAAMLLMLEDEYAYDALHAEYQRRLAAMRPPVTAEYVDVG